MPLIVLDGTGAKQNMSTTTDAGGNLVGSAGVTDPNTGAKQGVGTHHTADAQNASGDNSALVAAVELLWNGASFDRKRSNWDYASSLVILSAQGAGTVNSPDQAAYNHKGIQLGINITAITSATLTITIQGKDVVSGQYYTILQSAALNAIGFTRLTVHPGLTAAANIMANDFLPRTWRISAVVTGTSVTATVGASLS